MYRKETALLGGSMEVRWRQWLAAFNYAAFPLLGIFCAGVLFQKLLSGINLSSVIDAFSCGVVALTTAARTVWQGADALDARWSG